MEKIIYLSFLIINFRIIHDDFKYKKIKNNYIIILFILFFCYLFHIILLGNEIDFFDLFIYFIGVFLFSFLLYYFNIWAGGDTKYFFVLSLFLYFFSFFIDFLINFSFLLIIYIFFGIIYHYLKIFFSLSKIKNFFLLNYELFKEKYLFIFFDEGNEIITKDLNKKKVFYINIINYISLAVFLFIFIRLFRGFILNYIDIGLYIKDTKEELLNLIKYYGTYIIFGIIGILYLIRTIIMYIINFIKNIFKSKKELTKENYFKRKFNLSIFYLVLNIGTIFFFYLNNGISIFSDLYKFFIRFITFSIFIKLAIYLFKIYFKIYEEKDINIENLKVGDYINYEFLEKKIGNIYDYVEENDISKINNPLKLALNPASEKIINELKELIEGYNKFHKEKNTINFEELKSIKIGNTFAFSFFLFFGFIITVIFQTNFIKIYILR